MIDSAVWSGRRVFLTGHTGFKGSWMVVFLHKMGAQVTGYSLVPSTDPSLFIEGNIQPLMAKHHIANVEDLPTLRRAMEESQPEIVFHMAAQPLVRESYVRPVETFRTNVIGTANLLDAVRTTGSVRAVVNVTTDKVYENPEHAQPFAEDEKLGGYDPYSASKACSEIVTAAYRQSFFNPGKYSEHKVAVASARAGNVIGGGDWSADRLVPDLLRALLKDENPLVRNPVAVRPWQHVLEPLSGYLMLAEHLFKQGAAFAEAFNFGPDADDMQPVLKVAELILDVWGKGQLDVQKAPNGPHEAGALLLDNSKARKRLGWTPVWNLKTALTRTVEWTRHWHEGNGNLIDLMLQQISQYESDRNQ